MLVAQIPWGHILHLMERVSDIEGRMVREMEAEYRKGE